MASTPPGIRRLFDEARFDVDEVLQGREMSRTVALARATGIEFETRQFPMYFTGDFEALLVLVHLNSKASRRMDNDSFDSFDKYLDGNHRFGYYHWEMDSTYRSAFDHKQVRFLRPFGAPFPGRE